MLSQFEKEFSAMSGDIQKQLKRMFQRGIFDIEEIRRAFSDNGYSDLINAWVDNYSEMIKFNKDIAKEIGVNFMLSKDAIRKFDLITESDIELINGLSEQYIADMKKMGARYLLEGKSFSDVAFNTELSDTMNTLGRRLATEAYTGIYQADSAIKLDFFNQAGIERFYYDGPLDNVTRDICEETLRDSKQQTGWTMEEIESSATPFIVRGGYNCRHEWLPFIGGSNAI